MVSDVKEEIQTEGVWEQGAEDNSIRVYSCLQVNKIQMKPNIHILDSCVTNTLKPWTSQKQFYREAH
jgi:hypothetical protein